MNLRERHLFNGREVREECVIEWFKNLHIHQMIDMIATFKSILEVKGNCAFMTSESVETIVILYPIVKLQRLCPQLNRLVSIWRRNIAESKQACRIYDRLRLPKVEHLTYQDERRGDLSILSCKWDISCTPYRAGIVWIYLSRIITQLANCSLQSLIFSDRNHAFLSNGCWLNKILHQLASVCKEWRVVIKYHCVWWGPGGQYYALMPSAHTLPKYKPGYNYIKVIY